jgi:glycosyltransferase involved in cell wall biosynthesis
MRVMFVIDSLAPGGAERSTVALAEALHARDVDVEVVSLKPSVEGFADELVRAGVRHSTLASRSFVGRVRELRRHVRRHRPDVVHSALFMADITSRLACVAIPTAVVSSLVSVPRLHDGGTSDIPLWKLKVVEAVDAASSWALVDRLHAVTPGVGRLTGEAHPCLRGKIVVVERGRDLVALGGPKSADRRHRARAMLGVDPDCPVVVTVGRHEQQKAHVDLVAAVDAVRVRVPEAVLLVAGREGHETPVITAEVERRGLTGSVMLLGHRSDVGDVLSAADCFALSSHHEGAAGAVLEAMAVGIPIVSTDLPGLEGVLVHEENALLTPVGDSVAMAEAIERVLADRSLAERLTVAARQTFEERFTLDASADRMLELYRSVLAQCR